MNDELWKNLSSIILAIGVLLTTIGTFMNLFWQHRAAAKLDVLKVQTDGMSKRIECLAGEAGEKRGADAERATSEERKAEVQTALAEQTEVIVSKVTTVVKTNGNGAH